MEKDHGKNQHNQCFPAGLKQKKPSNTQEAEHFPATSTSSLVDKNCRKTKGEQGKVSFHLLYFPELILLRVCTESIVSCVASPSLQLLHPSPGSCPARYQPPAPSFFHRWILALLVQTELRFPFIRTGYSIHSSAGVNQKLLLCPPPGGISDLSVAV